jgi:hypothetical protein
MMGWDLLLEYIIGIHYSKKTFITVNCNFWDVLLEYLC